MPARPGWALRWRPVPGVNPFGDEALDEIAERGLVRGADLRRTRGDASERPAGRRDRLRHQLGPPAGRRGGRRRPGLLVDVEREMRIVRLGRGGRRHGSADRGGARPHLRARSTSTRADRSMPGVDALRFVATSATRDAENRDVFVSGIRGRLGVEPEVISGDEEAALSFAGATSGLEIAGAATPCLVVDIGGGSTEFVMGEPGRPPTASASVDVGCVRMTERHFVTDPPWPAEVGAARDDIDAAIARGGHDGSAATGRILVGLAGSVTTVAALAMGMWEYDAARIHGAVITAADVHRVCEELLYSTSREAGGEPGHAPGPGRRDRGRLAGAVGDRGLHRRWPRSWSASTTSSTASRSLAPTLGCPSRSSRCAPSRHSAESRDLRRSRRVQAPIVRGASPRRQVGPSPDVRPSQEAGWQSMVTVSRATAARAVGSSPSRSPGAGRVSSSSRSGGAWCLTSRTWSTGSRRPVSWPWLPTSTTAPRPTSRTRRCG